MTSSVAVPVFVRAIRQRDNHSFIIEWTDGAVSIHKLCDLQRNCPCASCCQSRSVNPEKVVMGLNENVRAVKVKSVGRYALRIDFTSGCSSGIYDFELLRSLSSET